MSDERQRYPAEGLQFENPTDSELLAEAVKVIEFYEDCGNMIVMDGKWYEYADSNVDITQYATMGQRARDFLAKLGR